MFRKKISFPSSLSKSKRNKKYQQKAGRKPNQISLGFLLLLLFNPEDGGDIFIENVGLSPNCTVLQHGEP
jgi:hypothetical protein